MSASVALSVASSQESSFFFVAQNHAPNPERFNAGHAVRHSHLSGPAEKPFNGPSTGCRNRRWRR